MASEQISELEWVDRDKSIEPLKSHAFTWPGILLLTNLGGESHFDVVKLNCVLSVTSAPISSGLVPTS